MPHPTILDARLRGHDENQIPLDAHARHCLAPSRHSRAPSRHCLAPSRHSREGGNPVPPPIPLVARLRGHDENCSGVHKKQDRKENHLLGF